MKMRTLYWGGGISRVGKRREQVGTSHWWFQMWADAGGTYKELVRK